MSESFAILGPVEEYAVGGTADGEAIVGLKARGTSVAASFNGDQLTDFATQLLAWAGTSSQAQSRGSEVLAGRPIRAANIGIGPGETPETVTLAFPIGALRLQFQVPAAVVVNLAIAIQRGDVPTSLPKAH